MIQDMSDDARPVPPLPGLRAGLYRHYKGQLYQAYGVARHSETFEPVVVYRPLYGEGALWVRPYEMFTGTIEVDGRVRQRFAWEADVPGDAPGEAPGLAHIG